MDVSRTSRVVNESTALGTPQIESMVQDSQDVQTINTVIYVINFIATPILCILGIVGNVLNIIVLRHCGFKDTNVLFLESLTMADLMLSVVHSFLHVHYIIEKVDIVTASIVGSYSNKYLFGPYNTLMCVVQFQLVVIAVERVIAVYFPFHVARIFTRSRVMMCIVFMYVLTIVLFFPASLIHDVGWVDIPETNQTQAILIPSQFFLVNYDVLVVYLIWGLGKLTDTLLPGTVILCCVSVGLKLWRRKKQFLPKVKKKNSNDLNGFRLLMAVCVVAILFAVTGQVMNYLQSLNDRESGPFYQLSRDFTSMKYNRDFTYYQNTYFKADKVI